METCPFDVVRASYYFLYGQYTFRERLDFAKAFRLLFQARNIFEKTGYENIPEAVYYLSRFGDDYYWFDDYKTSIQYMELAARFANDKLVPQYRCQNTMDMAYHRKTDNPAKTAYYLDSTITIWGLTSFREVLAPSLRLKQVIGTTQRSGRWGTYRVRANGSNYAMLLRCRPVFWLFADVWVSRRVALRLSFNAGSRWVELGQTVRLEGIGNPVLLTVRLPNGDSLKIARRRGRRSDKPCATERPNGSSVILGPRCQPMRIDSGLFQQRIVRIGRLDSQQKRFVRLHFTQMTYTIRSAVFQICLSY